MVMNSSQLNDSHLISCPECEYTGTLDDFDVIGADEGNLFCTQCHKEFNCNDATYRADT